MSRKSIILPLFLIFTGGCARSFPDSSLFDLLLFNTPSGATPGSALPYSVSLSVSSLFTTEAGPPAQTFTAVLTTAPTADVIIPVSSSNIAEGNVSPDGVTYGPFSLTFTAANWNVPQTVSVVGIPDGVADASLYTTYNVVLGAITSTDPNYNGTDPTDLLAMNYDIDSGAAPGVSVVPTTGFVTSESGNTDRFAVVLTARPSIDVIIDLASSNTAETSVSPATLTFTSANWSTPQSVTVTGVDELLIPVQDGNQTVTITPTVNPASDPVYLSIMPATVSVTNADNDAAGITVGAATVFTSENSGSVQTFQIVLNTQPAAGANVSFTLTSSDTTEAQVSLDNITYGASAAVSIANAAWSTPVTVYVKGIDDFTVDGDIVFSLGFSAVASADANYSSIILPAITGKNFDNDGGGVPGITVTPNTGLITSEGGGTALFAVVLDAQPTANVVIDLASSNTAEATVSPVSLTFTTANWNTPQTATITGVNDTLQDGNKAVTITPTVNASSAPAYLPIVPATVSVTNTDNDTAGITVGTSSVFTSENSGSVQTFQIVLNTQPSAGASVSFNITSSDTTEAQVSLDNIAYGASVGILVPNASWNVPQTVYVKGIDDITVDGNIAFNLNFTAVVSADGNYSALGILPAIAGRNFDNDGGGAPGITVTPNAGLITSEAGGTAQFAVVLQSQPSANVVIPISSGTPAEGTPSVASLTFTSANWNTPQPVVVTGVNDNIADADTGYMIITDPATSGDTNYNGLNASDVTITNLADTAGVQVSPVAGHTISESGTTSAFIVYLTQQPQFSVTMNVSVSDTTEATITTPFAGTSGTLTFTSANWNTPQVVTVQGLNDLIADGNIPFTVVIAATSSLDLDYNGTINPPDVALTNVDDDLPGITVTVNDGIFVSEAATMDTFTIVLNSQPTASVSLNAVSSLDATEFSVNPATVTFTTGNWSTPQTITVTGVNDAVADGNITGTIELGLASSTDLAYNNFDPGNVIAFNADNDTGTPYNVVFIDETSLYTTESVTTAQFKVVLNSQPTANVSFNSIISSDLTEGSVAPGTITFTPLNWNTPQTITITGAADDGDVIDTVYSVSLGSATSLDTSWNGVTPASVSVTNKDVPVGGVSLTLYARGSAAGTFNSIALSPSSFKIPFDPTNPGTYYGCDEGAAYVQIGFPFKYLGNYNTKLTAYTNGLVSFDPAFVASTWGNTKYSLAGAPLLVLAPWWDDQQFCVLTGVGVYYQLSGTAPNRKMTIEWSNTVIVGQDEQYNFQIELYETTNVINFIYGAKTSANPLGTSASAGLKDGVGGADNTILEALTGNRLIGSVNNAIGDASFPVSGTTITFTPP